MAVTLKDIAERSGMSLQTVSRILNGNGERHLAETRERVIRIATEMGYRPNSSAKAIRSGRFTTIALLLSELHENSLLPDALRDGILDALIEREIALLMARLPDTILTSDDRMPRILREMMADGLLINYNAAIPAEMINQIARHRIPAIWLNSRQEADCIYPNDFEAGVRATEYLLAMGHRRIVFHSRSPVSHYSYTDRQAGYAQAMQRAGLPVQTNVSAPDLTHRESARFSMPWLLGEDRPTAVLTYSIYAAMPLLYAAMLVGVSVPGDLSLLTFHERLFNEMGFTVDTMLLPEREIGRSAVAMLLEKIQDPSRHLSPHAVPLTLAVGQTCSPPASHRAL